MFGLLKKRKKRDQPSEIPQDGFSGRVQKGIDRLQQKWALFMARLVSKFSLRQQKTALIVFILLGASYCTYVLLSGLSGKSRPGVSIDPISIPRHIEKTGEENLYPGIYVTDEDYAQVQQFHAYMDSLKSSASGKKVYDSIVSVRKGLMDSIRTLEDLYKAQSK